MGKSRKWMGIVASGVLASGALAQVFSHDSGTFGLPGTAVNAGPDVADLFTTNCLGMNFFLADGVSDLGLVAGDNIDALDDGTRVAQGDIRYRGSFVFSVEALAIGQPMTPVNLQNPFNGADVYELDLPGHVLFKDNVPIGLASNAVESIDALALDPDGTLFMGSRVYFSLGAGSPTLAANGWSAADVLTVIVGLPGTLGLAIDASSLGLSGSDDLDGLVLLEIDDSDSDGRIDGAGDTMFCYFSVTDGSVGVPGTGVNGQSTMSNGSRGDIFSSGGAGFNALLYDGVRDIELGLSDDIDALDADLYAEGGDIPPPPEKPVFCPYPGVRIPSGGFWINICDMTLPDTVNVSMSVKVCNPDGTSTLIRRNARLVGFGGGNGLLKAGIMAGQLRAMTVTKADGTVIPVFAGIQIRPPVGQPGNIVAQVCANISQEMIDCGYNIDGICVSMSNWTATIIPIPLEEEKDEFKRMYEVTVPQPSGEDGVFGITFGAPDPVSPVVERIETPFLSGEDPSDILGRMADEINLGGGDASVAGGTTLVIRGLGVEPAPTSDGVLGPYIFEAGALDNPLDVTIEAYGVDPVEITHPLGTDRWAVVPGTGVIEFGFAPGAVFLPPGFFGTGSQPLELSVPVIGIGSGPGDTDTEVHRLDDFRLPAPGASDTVEIEIVALGLRSVQPIEVQTDFGPTLWDVELVLDQPAPSDGDDMFAMRDGAGFGGFDLNAPVQPVLVFTNVDFPAQQEVVPLQGRVFMGGMWTETPAPGGVSDGPNWFGDSAVLQIVLPGESNPAVEAQLMPATGTPGCPADLDNNGTLNFGDVTAFLTLYGQGSSAVDFDDNGSLNFGDVVAFLNLYALGCP